MNLHGITQRGHFAIRWGMATSHRRMVCLGLLVGLGYLPIWLATLFRNGIIYGNSDLLLVPALAYLGLQKLWQQRHNLSQRVALPEDRLIGYMLIGAGVCLFPFCLSSKWSLAFVWLVAMAGIAISTWGIECFKRFPFASGLIAVSAYPNFSFVTYLIWNSIVPPFFLENGMAAVSSWALQRIGQSAIAVGRYIQLPNGGVEVASGCSGFDMAVAVAGFGFILGVFFKQPWRKTASIMLIGVILALVFNVPRVMLLTFAVVYWGHGSFEFWHGPIGGQIFSSILLTAFYYLAMGVLNHQPAKSLKP